MLVIFNKNLDIKAATIVFVVLVLSVCGFIIGFGYVDSFLNSQIVTEKKSTIKPVEEKILETTSVIGMQKFSSEEEMKVYLEEKQVANNFSNGLSGGLMRQAVPTMAVDNMMEIGTKAESLDSAGSYTADRMSETNVQVSGIDEADIVKTDGKEIYISSLIQRLYYKTMPMMEGSSGSGVSVDRATTPSFVPPYYEEATTKLVNAFPVDKINIDSELKTNGNLLLSDNILTVLGTDGKITSFDVSDKKEPKEVWNMSLGNKSRLSDARLMNGKLYLLVSEYANYSRPCPIRPLTVGDTQIEIACADIYYPTVNTEIDAAYSFLSVDIKTGEVLNKNSFLGSYNNANFYMSQNAAYATYVYNGDMVKFAADFFLENKDVVPNWLVDKLQKLSEYDLSDSAKMTEMSVLLSRWQNSMDEDSMLTVENELANRGEEYYQKHLRDLNYTGIVKFSLDDLSIKVMGSVSGQPLNQFSFDEYNGYLRVATTVGQQGFWLAGGMLNSRNQTVSDVNILDENLKAVGQVRDLGKAERIYSVRFIADKGYVVTFKQTDPFYVLDLQDERNPVLKGELKIPGYSSYLHPINDNLILGIGKEDNYVKLSLFDVSDASNPKETAKYTLKEYWSEALNNHHAFLIDTKHRVFFIPGSQGGYIVSYENGLSLKKAVSENQIQRAVYLDDYMYLIGDNSIVVLDENTWERAGELKF